ncbi:MAG: SNF2 helicase associated domain-containing protein [Kiritimatiellales bacterium]
MKLPFTQKMLQDWAGWKAFRDGKTLFERGVVDKVEYDHPFISGELAVGIRGMRSKFELTSDGLVENHCPCRDNQERGLICAHLVALGMAALRQYSDPNREVRESEEQRRARRLEQIKETQYITRVPKEHPRAVSAVLRLELNPGWQQMAEGGRFPLICTADYRDQRVLLDQIPRDLPLSFTPRDENLLFVLEDISEGPAKGQLTVSEVDFVNLLKLCIKKPIYITRQPKPLQVFPETVETRLTVRLDQTSGDVKLKVEADIEDSLFHPLFVMGSSEAWVFDGAAFRKITPLLPPPLRKIYHQPIRIPRAAVPNFIRNELPGLQALIEVETDVSEDLFSIRPAEPRFRLVVSGSQASLSAKLYVEYSGTVLIAGRDEAAGGFSIPDPDDLLGYRIRNSAAEKEALEKLAFSGFRGHRGDLLTAIVGQRDVLNFLGGAVPKIRRFGWRVELEGRVEPFMDGVESITPVIHISQESGGGFFDVSYEYENTGGQSLSEGEIQRALNMGEAFVEKNGRTILLDIDAIETAREVFSDCAFGAGGAPGSFRMNDIYSAYVQSSLMSLDGVDIEASPDWLERAKTQNRNAKIEPEPLGEKLEGTLRDYQKDGVYWLRFLD